MISNENELTQKKIFNFWAPLAATWLMMALEGPILTSFIARLSDATLNLAAYGVAHPLAMMIESPIIMMLSASIALVKDAESLRKMQRFSLILNGLVTLGMLIVILPPVFYFLAYHLLFLPPDIAWRAHYAIIILLPWPAAIGFRRFYQGILITNGFTKRVAIGTIARLVSMLIAAFVLSSLGAEGVIVGAAGLSFGVVCEALWTRYMAQKIIHSVRNRHTDYGKSLTAKRIVTFYYPLALTSVIGMGVSPILTFFIGHSRMPVESWAVFPVVDSFVFLFRSFGFAYQEVGMALLGERHKNHRPLWRFGTWMAIITSAVLSLIAFSPFSSIILEKMYGLNPTLADVALVPMKILCLLPALSVYLSMQRAVIMNAHQNTIVTISTLIEVIMIIAVIATLVYSFHPIGVVAAAISLLTARIISNLYLAKHHRRILREAQLAT
jgi:O-antigen/teichoic acid export membrane protein